MISERDQLPDNHEGVWMEEGKIFGIDRSQS